MKCPECDGTGKVQKWFYERTGFGKCEKVCPQHLPIRNILSDVAETFDKKQEEQQ